MSRIHDLIFKKSWQTVMLYDLDKLRVLYQRWINLMPKIKPYYAVKCNSNIELIRVLNQLGANFDCASKHEIQKVLKINKSPDRIIFSNPCKYIEDIKYARTSNVNLTVVDSQEELEKLDKYYNNIEILLRIYANDETAMYKLSKKYGAQKNEWIGIINKAINLNLNIVGVSFHIGSGATDSNAYIKALEDSKVCIELIKTYGYKVKILDIGGGFSEKYIESFAKKINKGINDLFGSENIKFIAEPGRYFAQNLVTLYTKVFGKKIKTNNTINYFISDGIYGCFNCELHGDACPQPKFLTKKLLQEKEYKSNIYGPTCDSEDIVLKNYTMPEIQINDYIIWHNMGAYTIVASSDFNGINQTKPTVIYKYNSKFYYKTSIK